MTFDRKHIDADYLMITKMIRNLCYRRHNYDKGTTVRTEIDSAIEALEKLKNILTNIIDERSENEKLFKQ